MASAAVETAPARWAAWFVWGLWAVLVAGWCVYLGVFAENLPHGDDWDLVPYVTGEQDVTWDWLWGLHGEHRLVLPKLALVALFQPFQDFRAGMVFNLAALAGLAAALLVAARMLRGWTDYPDAFLPLAVLNPGHFWTVLWNLQVVFALPTLLAGVVFLVLLRQGCRLTIGGALLAGVCTLLLPFCGGPGLTYAPALMLWLALAAVVTWWTGQRGAAVLALLFAGLVTGGMVLYLHGSPLLSSPTAAPTERTALLQGAARYLAVAFGPFVEWHWPASAQVLAGVVVVTLGAWAWGWVTRPEQRGRLTALGLFAGVFLGLAVALGRGRTDLQLADMIKYVTVLVPVLYWMFFAWELAAPRTVARAVQWGLVALLTATLVPNTAAALAYGQKRRDWAYAFLDDLYEGVPPYQLVKKHSIYLYPYAHDTQSCPGDFQVWLPLLRKHDIGPFGSLAEDPEFQEVEVRLKPVSTYDLEWRDGTIRVTGEAPQLELVLPRARHVAGLRIDYRDPALEQGARPAVTVYWRGPEDVDYPDKNNFYFEPLVPMAEQTIFFWVDERVKQLRLVFDPGTQSVRLRRVAVYLLPPGPSS